MVARTLVLARQLVDAAGAHPLLERQTHQNVIDAAVRSRSTVFTWKFSGTRLLRIPLIVTADSGGS